MTDRGTEKMAEKETSALQKLQAAAGLSDRTKEVERLDWMYEQSASSLKPTDEELMNKPVAADKDKDMEDMKKLMDNTAGSLFLKSATKTTEDMLRKLREDPLFQVRRQEQAAKESMMANPLVKARLQAKAQKAAKKAEKKAKKNSKKEEKKAKKAAKKAIKKATKKAASSSSSSSDSDDKSRKAPVADAPPRRQASPDRRRSRSPRVNTTHTPVDTKALGPTVNVVSKREEYAAQVKERKEAAIASRGAPRRMDDAEKARRLAQMEADAKSHELHKDKRIAAAETREREVEQMEATMRNTGKQEYFKKMQVDAYMGNREDGKSDNLADRLKNQRNKRAKNLNDPLEKDD